MKIMTLERDTRNDSNLEKTGRNVTLHALYFRHAEKASGVVGTGSQVSASLLSPRGEMQSASLGNHLAELSPRGVDGTKMRSSGQPRTYDSVRAMGRTGQKAGILEDPLTQPILEKLQQRKRSVLLSRGLIKQTTTDKESSEIFWNLPIPQRFQIVEETMRFLNAYAPRVKFELSPEALPKDFFALYVKKWDEVKNVRMNERGIDPASFSSLTSKQQAEIAEPAEEPVAAEWLENPDSEMARLFPPEIAASQMATLVRRDTQMAMRLKSGSSFDLFGNTHRTITEPLLMYIAKLPNGQRPKHLSDIGGLLGLNDGYELRTTTDQKGIPTTKLFLYRVVNRESDYPEYAQTEYEVDLNELNRLADVGVQLARERRRKDIAENPELWKLKEN